MSLAPLVHLAQAMPTGRLLFLIGGVIVAVIIAGLVLLRLRRSLLASSESDRESLNLETLQRQHRAGEISDEEFRSLRRALLGLPPESAEPEPGGEDGPAAP